jgi:hypothetical protein
LRHEAAAASQPAITRLNVNIADMLEEHDRRGRRRRFSRKIYKTYSFKLKIAESSKIIEFVIFKLS